MSGVLLTQNSTFIIGPVSQLLGYIMEGIFNLLNLIGIEKGSIGLSIILFTIVIYLLLMPLTIKQQKFSKLSAKMNPEIQAIQAKYKNRKDQDSMMAMNAETKEVYAKYGVSPSGSCLQLLIQMPILFALYRVIYAMPAYVGKIKDAFLLNAAGGTGLVDKLIAEKGSAEFIQTFKNAAMYSGQFANESFTNGTTSYVQNTYIDVLNKASSTEWSSIATQFPSLAEDVKYTTSILDKYNNFLGLNIANSPSFTISEAWTNFQAATDGKDVFIFIIIGALLVPILAALTQWINVKLMPQVAAQTGDKNDQQAAMMSSMKMMNYMMPVTSAIFCFTLPAGMGLYWIAGAVVRTIQQIIINKHIDKMDLDEIMAKNKEKNAKKNEKRQEKLEKLGIDQKTMNDYATIRTKNIDASKVEQTNYNNPNVAKEGSFASKANMVKQFNEKNNK